MRDLPATRPHTLRAHLRETMRLAFPVMLARLGVLTIVAMDTAMSGHASADDLAWYVVAVAPQVPLLLVGIGLLMGTVVMTAQAVGAGKPKGCGAIWRTALVHALGAGALMALACAFGESFLLAAGQPAVLLAAGQPADIAAGGGRVLAALGLGLPGLLLYVATSFFLEGIGRPIPGMVIMIGANVLNVGLNWLLVFGHGGFPALGAEGAAIATSIVRLGHVRRRRAVRAPIRQPAALRDHGRGAIRPSVSARACAGSGLPAGLAHGMESSAFAAMTLIAGLLGAAEVGGYSIPMNLLALAFMGAIGLATAASVRVGNAVGRGTGAACAGPDGWPPAWPRSTWRGSRWCSPSRRSGSRGCTRRTRRCSRSPSRRSWCARSRRSRTACRRCSSARYAVHRTSGPRPRSTSSRSGSSWSRSATGSRCPGRWERPGLMIAVAVGATPRRRAPRLALPAGVLPHGPAGVKRSRSNSR